MANDITIKDGSSYAVKVKTTETNGTHVPHHNIDNLEGIITSLQSILTELQQNAELPISGSVTITGTPTVNTGLSQSLTNSQLRATPVDVTGNFYQTTQPVSVISLPLPSGAATEAKQPALGTAGASSTDVITVQGIAGGVAQPVTIATLPALATGTNTIGAISNTSFAATQSGAWDITNISGTISLPTEASTSALQTTGNTSLSNIDTKTPALGQALAAASIPVVLPAVQVTALTPPTTVGVNSLPALSTGSNAIGSITNTSFGISGTLPAFTTTPTFNLGTAPNLTFTNTSFIANAGTNLNTSALALESGGNLAAINTKLPSNLTVSATRLLVDGSGVTQPVSMNFAPPGLVWESTDTITITRAAMTTYMASSPNFDVYGGLFELQNIGVAGKGIFLTFFEIDLTLNAVPTGMTSFQVFLSPTAPTSIADNNIFTLNSGAYLDKVGFSVPMSLGRGGGKVVGVIKDLNQLFILTSSSLWGYLVTNGAIVPAANSEEGTIRARSFAP